MKEASSILFQEYYHEKTGEIEKTLDSFIEPQNEELKDILNYSLKNGKRFRPTLCVLVSDIFGGDKEEALNNAAIVEFIHSSSLIHDDVIDNDKVRRAMPSLWKKLEGENIQKDAKNLAILLGDGMLSTATRINKNARVIEASADALNELARGSLKEAYGEDKDEESYLEVIRLKTGSLFGLATELGSIAAKTSEEQTRKCKEAGIELGIIYQLADDYADGEARMDKKKIEKLIKTHCKRFVEKTESMPENNYTEMFESVPVYLVNKMFEERGMTLKLKEGFEWEK